jgi:hypothetical protein
LSLADDRDTLEVLLDIECALIDKFGWSLVDIDETDYGNLLAFLRHYPKYKNGIDEQNQTFCDEVNWL